MKIQNIKNPILVEYVKKFHYIRDDGVVCPKFDYSRKEANEWLVEHIENTLIKDYINRYCFIRENGDIIFKSNGTYLGLITTDYPCNSFINFLAEHKIYDVYSWHDFRKSQKSKVACCGFSETEQRWYGWTHRGVRSFGIGDTYFNYLGGKQAKTLGDCKKLAFYAVQELT